MKDIPVFTTQHGVASLTLREIPYSKKAYIRLQSSLNADQLLAECVDFCRAVGAEEIFATGNNALAAYPLYTEIVEMAGNKSLLVATDARLISVTAAELTAFRDIYNERMATVPNAAYMTILDADAMLARGNGYFIKKEDQLIGIGIAGEGTIEMLAAIVSGSGKDVLSALATVLTEEKIRVEVATENKRAMALYEHLGFQIKKYIATWYKIYNLSRKTT